MIPWSPLARGALTRDPSSTTARQETDEFGKTLYGTANLAIVERVAQIAAARGVSRAAVGLAWVARHPWEASRSRWGVAWSLRPLEPRSLKPKSSATITTMLGGVGAEGAAARPRARAPLRRAKIRGNGGGFTR